MNEELRRRLRPAALHLAATVAVATGIAAVVFVLWYPWPFREISGGRELFLLIIAVDVVVGPLLTLAVFDVRKPARTLVLDLGVIVGLQVVALGYGLYTAAIARPVVVALEGDRLRVVRAIDLEAADLSTAPRALRTLPWTGPVWVSTRKPASPKEKEDALFRGLAGDDVGMRPEFWQAPELAPAALTREAKPLSVLLRRQPAKAAVIEQAAAHVGLARQELGYLPIVARRTDWSALVSLRDGRVVGYLAVDGF